MKLSKKTDYALRALFTLLEHEGQGPLALKEIARSNNIPQRFLEHIMLDMKEMNWVKSVPGRYGGYLLACGPEQITMGQIVRHFDGVLAPVACVSITGYQACSEEPRCVFRSLLAGIRDSVAEQMDRATLHSVYRQHLELQQHNLKG